MATLQITSNPSVKDVFNNYPETVREKMIYLRELILETAEQTESITSLEETLKWGEPSYLTKHGSTLRMGWKQKTPDQYAMYFQCTSRLISAFRVVFKNTLQFEGKRAIVFGLNDPVPVEAVRSCIRATLTYHKVKHLPTLGM